MKEKDPCPCLFCKIERERDFSCREMSCQTYVEWRNKHGRKNIADHPGKPGAGD